MRNEVCVGIVSADGHYDCRGHLNERNGITEQCIGETKELHHMEGAKKASKKAVAPDQFHSGVLKQKGSKRRRWKRGRIKSPLNRLKKKMKT